VNCSASTGADYSAAIDLTAERITNDCTDRRAAAFHGAAAPVLGVVAVAHLYGTNVPTRAPRHRPAARTEPASATPDTATPTREPVDSIEVPPGWADVRKMKYQIDHP
jgi:hypothetical protein